jgi:hypothetical protein
MADSSTNLLLSIAGLRVRIGGREVLRRVGGSGR